MSAGVDTIAEMIVVVVEKVVGRGMSSDAFRCTVHFFATSAPMAKTVGSGTGGFDGGK